jgi:hypothetical protein
MKVETYEDIDVRSETEPQSAEALTIIESLGLKGQLTRTNSDTKTRIPYRLMTDEEAFVYGQLCPEKCRVEEYSNGPIPLEVLKTLAYAKTLGVYDFFEVWSATSVKVKDPVLFGCTGSQWSPKRYILARWGDELLPLEVLIPTAVKNFYAKRQAKLLEIKNQVDIALTQQFDNGAIPSNSSLPYLNL